MNTTVQSLQDLYVKLGGSLTDTYDAIADGATVGDYVTIPDMIEAITQKAGSGGGSGSDGVALVTVTTQGDSIILGISLAELFELSKTHVVYALITGTAQSMEISSAYQLMACVKNGTSYFASFGALSMEQNSYSVATFANSTTGTLSELGFVPPDFQPQMLVTFTESGGTYSSDKTLEEINNAFDANKNVIGYNAATGYVLPCVYCNSSAAIFSCVSLISAQTYAAMSMQVTASSGLIYDQHNVQLAT